jgi:hypothetical protein
MKEMGMNCVAAKFVPSILTADQQFLIVIPHPRYSLDLAPCNFFLYPKMKRKLKGHRFDTIEENQAELQRVPDTLKEKGLPGSVPKIEMVGPVSTCRRELLQG